MAFTESAPIRGAVAAVVAALAFAVVLMTAYSRHGPTLLLTERGMGVPTIGFYPIERAGGELFVWTAQHASISLPDIDRRFAWRLHTGVHGWRPDGATPTVRVAVDGVNVLTQELPESVTALDVRIPPHFNRPGATVTFDTDPPFIPGAGDRRTLGVSLNSTTLVPAQHPSPPRTALLWGMAATGVLGVGASALGASLLLALVASISAGVATAAAFVFAFAAHGGLPRLAFLVAIGVAIGAWAIARGIALAMRERLSGAARLVIGLSALAGYLKLLVLLHPAAPVGDGVFHAHRFEYVLGGRFYFTSVAPGDYAFPYPVLLYIAAAPFSPLAHDTLQRMDLLRIVVTIADAVAGALLYSMIIRTTANRPAGVAAVAWYHLIPMTAWIMTWGNLTNAFGQALFVAALAAVAALPIARSRATMAAVSALAAAALLSHPSTCAILLAVFAVTAAAFWWRGGALRYDARAVAVTGFAAGVVAFVLYYAWFPTVYAHEFTRIAAASGSNLARATPELPIAARIRLVPDLAVQYLGWPALLVGAVGAWRMFAERTSPMLNRLLAAWTGACVLFLVVGIVTPVQMRTYFAIFPALAVTAAFGSVWAWRRSALLRAGIVAAGAAALWIGLEQWVGLFG